MIRQAHSYLAGAVSGTALIAVAVVAFVLLVSAQAFRDWPLSELGGGDQSVSIAPGKPAAGGTTPATAPATAPNAATGDGHRTSSHAGQAVRLQQDSTSAEALGQAVSPQHENSGSGGGSGTGSSPSNPSSGSNSGGNDGSGSSQPESAIDSPGGTADDAVNQVDETVGGALRETHVPEVAQGAVEGVAGPNSQIGRAIGNTVGKIDETVNTVHDTVGAVDGLLGPHR